MVNFCAIFKCGNRSSRDKDKSFYRLSAVIINQGDRTKEMSTRRRNLWLSRISRADIQNSAYIRVCSDHFINGRPCDLYKDSDPDWAPSVKLGHEKVNIKKLVSASDRSDRLGKRTHKKRKLNEDKAHRHNVLLTLDDDCIAEEEIVYANIDAVDEQENISSASVHCQTDMSSDDIRRLEHELQRLTSENMSSRTELLAKDMMQESFRTDDNKVKFYTGLPNFVVLMTVFNFVSPFISSTHRNCLTKWQEFLIVFMRLRLNLPLQDLAFRFNVSVSTASRIFSKWLGVMDERLKVFIVWPERDILRRTMPNCFKQSFGNKVAVIIDCFEVFIDRPSNMLAKVMTWSNYKHHNTVKFLIGITPQGTVSYISNAWGGRVSDKYLTEHSGMLSNLLPGDIVLADRGFDIADSVGFYCAQLAIPAFTRGKKQLSALDVESTRKIANVRIHVERVIGLVRRKYQILQSTLPIEMLISNRGGITQVDQIARICCALTNLCESVVPFD